MIPVAEKNEIIVYQPEGGEFHIEVRVENETVWLTQAQMAELFSKSISVISRHIANVFAEHELEEKSNLHFLQIANSDKPKWSNSTTLVAVLVLNELLCLFGVVKCTRMFGLWLRVLEFSM